MEAGKYGPKNGGSHLVQHKLAKNRGQVGIFGLFYSHGRKRMVQNAACMGAGCI